MTIMLLVKIFRIDFFYRWCNRTVRNHSHFVHLQYRLANRISIYKQIRPTTAFISFFLPLSLSFSHSIHVRVLAQSMVVAVIAKVALLSLCTMWWPTH